MSKFKVGDRVDTRGDYSFDPGRGTVVKAYAADDLYYVEMDGEDGPGCDPGWAYTSKHLTAVAVAPATATLSIEAGKFYKTRDGRKVGPMRSYDFANDGWCSEQEGPYGGYLWKRDGQRYFRFDRGGPTDLVAEWVDEPTASAPIAVNLGIDLNLPAKPQVGDDVLIFGTIAGITHSPRGTNYNIVFETQNRRMSLHFLDEDFMLDPGGSADCDCADNDNGTVPSTDTAKAFDAMGTWLRSLAVQRAA